jgi:SNF2 family DNA or RNA helicase
MLREIIPLWAHQRDTALKAATRTDGYALFFEQGCGKTATAITAIRHKCYAAQRLLRVLIICPPVVCKNWQREIHMHSTIKPESVHVLRGTGKERTKTFMDKAFQDEFAIPGIFITNYEAMAMPDLFRLFRNWMPDILLFDESQRVKEFKSKRTKLAIELADRSDYKMLLSGTPIINSAMDIWSQFRILDGGDTFDLNFYAFRAKYFYDKNAGMPSQKHFPDWKPRPGIDAEFNRMIYRKATRVLKSECLDLPPLVRQRIEVELSPEQARMYKDMRDDFVAYLGDKACVATIALTKGLRLQQIISGFWIDEDGEKPHAFSKNPRLEALKELLGSIASTAKVIVWASFRHNYGDLARVATELGLPSVSLFGGMTDKARQDGIDSFQTDDKVRVMIANPAAGGVGVTLTAASYMIYYSRSFSLEHDLQSEARCHRGGSEVHDKITRIDIVTPETIDEVILGALERKENMASSILKIRDLL